MRARLTERMVAWVAVLLLTAPTVVPAQTAPVATAPAAQPFTTEQLDQLAAPIALYPDPLIAQILMASTYPLEVVQAARFVKDNPNLSGDKLNEALKDQTWDDSVKSLVSFPQVLTMMDSQLTWTQKLGDAFLAQQKELMNAVQRLRAKAHAEGNLKSTPEQTVNVEPAPAQAAAPPPPPAGAPPPPPPPVPGQPPPVVVEQAPPQIITIVPANPQVIYVPTYNPTVVYGAWPYPAYPPYAYYPPGYVAGTALLSFGLGMAVGGALWGDCNWGHGDVDINTNTYNNYNKNVNRGDRQERVSTRPSQGDRGGRGDRQSWQHSPEHRQGAQYRDAATRDRYNRAGNTQATQARDSFRGRAEQGRQDIARGGADQFRGGAGRQPSAQPRPSGPGAGGAGGAGGGFGGQRPGGGMAQQQPARAAPSQMRGAGGGGGSAFQGVGQGRATQGYSNRGQASRQSMGGGGGGGGARGGGGGGGARGGGGGGGRGGGRR